jgi:hypothetical protein
MVGASWCALGAEGGQNSGSTLPGYMAGFCPKFCLTATLFESAHQLAPTCTMSSEPGSGGGPRKAGRPLDCITSHFTRNVAKPVKNNRWWWTCKYCATDLLGRDDNLAKHILTTCSKVPEQTRATEMARVANEPRPLPKKQRILTGGSAAGQETPSRVVDLALPSAVAQQANKELLRACVTSGTPFRLVDNPQLRRLVSLLRPSYALPSAHSFHALLPELSCQLTAWRRAEWLTDDSAAQAGRP